MCFWNYRYNNKLHRYCGDMLSGICRLTDTWASWDVTPCAQPHNNPEHMSHHHKHHCEYLKSHTVINDIMSYLYKPTYIYSKLHHAQHMQQFSRLWVSAHIQAIIRHLHYLALTKQPYNIPCISLRKRFISLTQTL